ncbi:hypothetical protein V8G54_026025 [Vigna mungo]|uniref:Uncharacterized protein n=1 Tax=Vigna mungo TaxID=3915 RepID=A0AAQ3RQ45_VIGMU
MILVTVSIFTLLYFGHSFSFCLYTKDYLEVFVPLCVLQEQWWIGQDGCFVFYWHLVAGSLIFFPKIRLAVSVHTHLKLAKWPDLFSQSTVWLFIARQRCGGWVKMIPSDQVKFLLSVFLFMAAVCVHNLL